MAPFRRAGGYFALYVPTGPGYKQISTGTTDARLAKRIEGMVKQLKNQKDYELLRALVSKPKKLHIDTLWMAYQNNQLEELRARLRAAVLSNFLPGWTLDAQRNAPAACADQVRQVKRLLGTMGPTLPALQFSHELTPGAIRDRINALAVSSGTARHYLYALSSFCAYLVAHAVIPSNPCRDADAVPRPKKSGKRKVWKTAETDQEIIARATCREDRIAWTLCAAAGADRASTLDIQVKHLRLLPVGSSPDPAKSLEHRIDIPGTKTEGRDRKGVRLEPWAAPILREAIAGLDPEAYLVTGCVADTLSRHWKIAALAAGHEDYWLRDTRHSYGVRAILAGYPLWEVSKWLGHANESITASIYCQFDYDVARLVLAGTITPAAEQPTKAKKKTSARETTTFLRRDPNTPAAGDERRRA
ncbi:tyrosine-type recombinase/integrase [Gemmatimonas sp.]